MCTAMTERISKKIGVKDIAALAGISIGTVDRVLHNRGEVKEETRKKVLTIVEELGYKPNILARSLSTKKTTHIAIVIPDSSDSNPYWEKPIQGIKKATEELESYNTTVSYVFFDASSEESFKDVLTNVCKHNPDGVILNPVFKSTSLHFIDIFNAQKIPYVFIDINIEGVANLGYFGQDAEQSGMVAARLMKSSLPSETNVLIVKQSDKKVFSQHIESRIVGFHKYFNQHTSNNHIKTITIEIDLLESGEPDKTLKRVFKEYPDVEGIFIPNSRTFKVADYLELNKNAGYVAIGYDLIDRNLEHLEKGNISYLISQKPEVQAYNAIVSLFNHLISKKEVVKKNYSPIDIIIKENIEYYKKNN